MLSHRRVVARMDARAAGLAGLDALRVVMLEALPLDDERDLEAQIEISFWGRALGNPELRDGAERRVRPVRRPAARPSRARRGSSASCATAWTSTLAAHQLLVLIDGLSAQRVLYPGRVTAARQRQMLDELLDSFRPYPG